MGKGDGKSRRGGDAQSPSSGFPRHILFVAARTSRLSDHFRPPRPAVPGVRGFLSADFMLSELSLCRMGRPWSAAGCDVPSLPPLSCHETRAPRWIRNGPRPNVSVRFERRARAGAIDKHRVKDAQSTLRARARALTSASGRTPPRTSDAPPPCRRRRNRRSVHLGGNPFRLPPHRVRPSTVSLRPTSLMRSLIVALTLRSRFPLTIARSSGHLNGRVFAPDPRIPPTHSRQNECPHGSVTGELDSPSLQKSRRHTAHRRSSRSLLRMRCRGVPAGVPARS